MENLRPWIPLAVLLLAIGPVAWIRAQDSGSGEEPQVGTIEVRLIDGTAAVPLAHVQIELRVGRLEEDGSQSVLPALLQTDEQGAAVVEDVPVGLTQLQVHVPGWSRFQTEAVDVAAGVHRMIEITLVPGTSLRGTIVCAAAAVPLDGVRATVTSLDHPANASETGARGTFQFLDLPLGEQVILLQRNGYIGRTVTVTIAEGRSIDLGVIELERDPLGTVDLTLVSTRTGVRIQGFALEAAWTEDGEEVLLPVDVEEADTLSLRLPAGEVDIRVEVAGHRPAILNLQMFSGVRMPVRLVLQPRE